jgi:hypothetical protein
VKGVIFRCAFGDDSDGSRGQPYLFLTASAGGRGADVRACVHSFGKLINPFFIS